jgi:chromosome segregation ATPase
MSRTEELEKLRNRLAHAERQRDELVGQLAAAQANARTFMRERNAAQAQAHKLRGELAEMEKHARWLKDEKRRAMDSAGSALATSEAERIAAEDALAVALAQAPSAPYARVFAGVAAATAEAKASYLTTTAGSIQHAPYCHATIPTDDRPSGGCICGALPLPVIP